MLKGFTKQTESLTDYELFKLVPAIVKCFQANHIGRENAITNDEMCKKLQYHNYNCNAVRMRKIINYIRRKGLVPCLIATSEGYYVTRSVNEMDDFIASLKGREDAIRAVRLEMEKQRNSISNYALF